MLYSILKDDKPKNTVKKIKKILKDLNINLKELLFIDDDKNAPVSIRLSFKNNPHIGTNGKGTCQENAMASAYAEFIERLQNLFLFDDYKETLPLIPDIEYVEKNIKYDNLELKKYFQKKVALYKKMEVVDKEDINIDKLPLIPFYSLKEKKIVKLPYDVVARTKGSNGMSAGNTLEEAFVQGLSEVCERYALKKIFVEKISMPDIPKENYMKYENIKKMVEYFERNGFKIHVKDASLNGTVPTICAIIEDTHNKLFTPSFGSHPSLPIAIERSLTEFTQGLMLSKARKYNFIGYQCLSKEKLKYATIEDIYYSLFLYKVAFERTKKLDEIFFNEEVSYPYNENMWISENKQYTNKELLDFLVSKLMDVSSDIYVRNVSFLGFPSIDIFIPDVTDLIDYNEKNIRIKNCDKSWSLFNQNTERKQYTVESLLKFAEIFSFRGTLTSKKIFAVPYEYIAFMCALVLKDTEKIMKYLDIIFPQNKIFNTYDEFQILTLKIIKDYFELKKSNLKENAIIEELNKKYEKDAVEYSLDVINELTFEMILDISVIKTAGKRFRGKTLFKKLGRKYKKNLPNQLDLKSVFE